MSGTCLQLPMIVNPSKSVEQYRFFVLAMQCPEADPTWIHGNDDAAGDMLVVTYEVLQKTLREQPVDQDRIYLSGVSSGGAGCWEMAMRHPDLFAAVAPMSSGGGDVSRVSKLVNIPIWAFHCLYDAPEGVEQTVAALREAGGNVHLTLLRSAIHDSWHDAFRGFGSFDWMLAQRRGDSILLDAAGTPRMAMVARFRSARRVPCHLGVGMVFGAKAAKDPP